MKKILVVTFSLMTIFSNSFSQNMRPLTGIIISFFTLFSTTAFSQIKIENFAFIQGNWVGVLEYTDYQDDKSKIQLKTTARFAQMFDQIATQYTYNEPDGSLVYDKGQISLNKKGDIVNFNGENLKW